MNNFKSLPLALGLLFCVSAYSQVNVDHPIILTGNGSNAKLTGIQSVTDPQDATSAQSIQNGGLISSTVTGSSNNFILNLSPAITSYQAGMMFNFISNQSISGPATLNVNGLGADTIKKFGTLNLGACDILSGQWVSVLFDGTNFQLNSVAPGGSGNPSSPGAISGTDTLCGNLAGNVYSINVAPQATTYTWSVPPGASITDGQNTNSITVTFGTSSGNISVTVGNTCGTSAASTLPVFIPVSSPQTFSYTGNVQTFTVPSSCGGVSSINISAYGAQGGSVGSNLGGMGGSATGTLSVSSGDMLYVYVGNQPTSATGGFDGGGDGFASGGYYGAGGGGASDVRVGGTALSNRVIIAGGGGGGTQLWVTTGGTGGGLNGGTGSSNNGPNWNGQGASQSGGGAMQTTCNNGTGSAGSLGQGGTSSTCDPGAGGGGGYYGGGGSDAGGGGGGSGYIGGVSGGSMQTGVQTGNGQVVISW